MKQLTDSERLEVAMRLLTGQQFERYRLNCIDLEQNCEHNGFFNVPAECENFECRNCTMYDDDRQAIDCPYVD